MKELWKPVEGFEGYYEVSNKGRVRSLSRQIPNKLTGGFSQTRAKVLTPTADKWAKVPYLYVSLSVKSKIHKRRVHNLVAHAFLGPRPAGLVTRHGARGTGDNSITNLTYGTQSENCYDTYLFGKRKSRTA